MFCNQPFEELRIKANGECYVCCPRWTDYFSIGNIFDAPSLEAVWNSEAAQSLRKSILDGSFANCDFNYCHKNVKATEQKYQQAIVDRGPRTIVCDYDDSCNLHCWMCRDRKIMISTEEQERLIAFQKRMIASPFFLDVEKLVVTSVGDPFASNVFWSLFEDLADNQFDGLDLRIRTHGLSLTPRNWERLGKTTRLIKELYISADGATKETYESIRLGGNFDELSANLMFLKDQSKILGFKTLLFYTVMAANFREIPQFIQFGETHGVHRVIFQKLFETTGVHGLSFRDQAIHLADHPEHQEFLDVIRSSECSSLKAGWSNLKNLKEGVDGASDTTLPTTRFPIIGQKAKPVEFSDEYILSLLL